MCGVWVIVHVGIVNDDRVYNMMRGAHSSDGVEIGCLTVNRLEMLYVLFFEMDGVAIVCSNLISHQHKQHVLRLCVADGQIEGSG